MSKWKAVSVSVSSGFVSGPSNPWIPSSLNSSESRGRPHPSPLPGGISIVIKSPRHCCRSGKPALHLLPTLSPVILAAAGIQSHCCHAHGWRMEVLPRAPAGRHCCPNRVGALSGLWIPAAARMTGIGAFPENVAVWSGKVGFLQAFAQITPLFYRFFVASGAVPDTNFFIYSAICCHLMPFGSGGVREHGYRRQYSMARRLMAQHHGHRRHHGR